MAIMKLLCFIFICLTTSWIDAIDHSWYYSGYGNSYKAIPRRLANVNLILASPHAGSLMPDDIPDRTIGGCRKENSSVCIFDYTELCASGSRCSVTTVQDFADYDPFIEWIADELYRVYDLVPFVIVANWNRKKIDFNRNIAEATFNHPKSMKAYRAYHRYLAKAIERIQRRYNGTGLLLDLHQHAQGNYTMVGMLLSGTHLNEDRLDHSSIEQLIQHSCPNDRQECIRGSKSLGTFMEAEGLGVAYPSINNPKPGNNTFYRGGYTTSNYSKQINVIQTELSFVVRNEFQPEIYVKKYVKSLMNFMETNRLTNNAN